MPGLKRPWIQARPSILQPGKMRPVPWDLLAVEGVLILPAYPWPDRLLLPKVAEPRGNNLTIRDSPGEKS